VSSNRFANRSSQIKLAQARMSMDKAYSNCDKNKQVKEGVVDGAIDNTDQSNDREQKNAEKTSPLTGGPDADFDGVH